MDRGDWQATIHGVARVGGDLATEQQNPETMMTHLYFLLIHC